MADAWGTSNTNGAEIASGGFETNNNSFALSTEVDAVQDEAGRIQEDKVNKKRLAELEEDGKMVQIFIRPTKKSGLVPYTAVKNIPLSVATICSNLFYEHFNKKRSHYYIIEDSNLAPYNFVFEWIKQCGDEKSVANLPEIKDMADSETGLQPFIDIMVVAAKLKIPTASFNKFMLKKLTFLARDYLIDLPTVTRIFDSGNTEVYDLGLQEVAATSILSHWYDYKLDGPESDDYMCELTEMRKNMQELDEALHKAVEDKDAWLKNKRQERREKQASEEAGGSWGATSGDNVDSATNETPASGGSDDTWVNQGATASTDDWENKGKTAANEWDKSDAAPATTAGWVADDGPTHGDWADEVIDNMHPLPAVTAGGGW